VKNLRRVLLLLLAVCLLPMVPLAYAEGNVLQNQAVEGGTINQNIVFVDVSNHWANDAIYDMAKKGIISGYSDSSFKPENSITREEFAKLIATTFSLNLGYKDAPTFSDVQTDRWSYSYIEATKEYLTGYYPPKGQAFFSPDTKATREDVAVALVKILGYTASDLADSGTLRRSFADVEDISFNLRDYVALAAENRLISGYEDRTFRPQNPITRAEVATLLYKVIKSSAQDQADGPALTVSMPDKTDSGTFYVSGTVSKGAKVTINGDAVDVTDGKFKEGYTLDKEGVYSVTIVAKLSSGKASTVRKEITYQVSGPQLKLHNIPESSDTESISITGTVTDPTDRNPYVYLNEQRLYPDWNGEFSTTVKLKEGVNTLTFKVVNASDKVYQVVKTVNFNSGAPVLKLSDMPESTSNNRLTISGKVKDSNDKNPVAYLNGEKLYVDWNGDFSKEVTLSNGQNTLTIKAENNKGKTTTIVKTVVFESDGPELKVDDLPSTVTTGSVTVTGKVKDKNDRNPTVYLNDEKLYVDWNGEFSKTVKLAEGENVLTVRAKNASGKTVTATKTIVYTIAAPALTLDYLPARTTLKRITLSGTVKDANDSSPNVYINDQKLYTGWNGEFTKEFDLNKGENVFTILGTNKYGKSTTVTRSVYQD
jgi:HSP20 family molecular chaperone IbpA